MAGAAIPRYAPLRSVVYRAHFLIDLLRAELAPQRRRIRNTIRMALIGTVGAGVMAACHVQTDLGTYALWTLVGAVAPMMGFGDALFYTIGAAVLLALSVPIAGILSETPWLLLPGVGLIITALSYIVTTRRFGSPGVVLKVVILDTFYDVVFHQNTFAETTAAAFGGTALAFGLLALFDTWIWPNRAEPNLLESLSVAVEAIRARMLAVADAYLDPRTDRFPSPPPPLSALSRHLDMLDRVASEGATAFRHAVLLAVISRTERLHNEVDRLTIIALENVPRVTRAELRRDLLNAVDAIADAIDEMAKLVPHEIPIGPDLPPPPAAARLKSAIASLDAHTMALRPDYIRETTGDDVVNFAAFVASLSRMAELLGRRFDQPHQSETMAHDKGWLGWPPYDASHMRYSIKVGIAIVLGYAIGVTSHHEDLGVILTTIIIAGLPTYGATVHKMILRLGGNLLGGALALLAIIIVTPNFETLPVYMMTFAIVFLIASYTSLSSGRIAYLGKQIGTAFVLTYAGLSPSEAVVSPLYRIWGIVIGVVLVGAVFFTIWPEYASASMLPRLRKVLRDTINMLPGTEVAVSQPKIDAISRDVTHTLFELLNVVDDAYLEGARCQIQPSAVVDACSNLRRIAHRFGRLDAERMNHPLPLLAPESATLYAEFISAMRRRLRAWIDLFGSKDALSSRASSALAASFHPDELTKPLRELNDRIAANQFAEVSSWTIEQRRMLFAEFQSFHRITELTAQLDQCLAEVPRS